MTEIEPVRGRTSGKVQENGGISMGKPRNVGDDGGRDVESRMREINCRTEGGRKREGGYVDGKKEKR